MKERYMKKGLIIPQRRLCDEQKKKKSKIKRPKGYPSYK